MDEIIIIQTIDFIQIKNAIMSVYMHAYLFIGGHPKERENKQLEFAKKNGKVFEFVLQKIADVRALSDFTKYSQNEAISIVIKDIDTATKEALNAFLKNLEEPGENVSYYLSGKSEQAILPTIVSRCRVIKIGEKQNKATSDTALSFIKMSFGQKIKSFENLKKKDGAKTFLSDLILSAHSMLINEKGKTQQSALLIKAAQTAINNLNLNANVNLQMTNFAIRSAKI